MIISIIGGTGKEGKGLALRWSKAGHKIIIGSRSREKAEKVAAEYNLEFMPELEIEGFENFTAAKKCEIAVITVPFNGHQAILKSIKDSVQGKIVVDVTVPLVPPKVTRVQMPDAGSAAMEAQHILGDNVTVVSAFQNVSYEKLVSGEQQFCDVLVCGSKKNARLLVVDLVNQTGLKGIDAGYLENSMVVEGLTSILIYINKQHGVLSSGIKITGLEQE